MQNKNLKDLFNPANFTNTGDVYVEGSLHNLVDLRGRSLGVIGFLNMHLQLFNGSFFGVRNFLNSNNITNYLRETSYTLDNKNQIVLSRNELASFFYCEIIGNTAKQVATLLNLSQRTVEKYLQRVREQYSDYYHKNDFIRIFETKLKTFL